MQILVCRPFNCTFLRPNKSQIPFRTVEMHIISRHLNLTCSYFVSVLLPRLTTFTPCSSSCFNLSFQSSFQSFLCGNHSASAAEVGRSRLGALWRALGWRWLIDWSQIGKELEHCEQRRTCGWITQILEALHTFLTYNLFKRSNLGCRNLWTRPSFPLELF